jgi:hypothetical protein
MKQEEFISWAQGYYGAYPAGQWEDVIGYLTDMYTEPELDVLRAVFLLRCPSHIRQVNGYPPDISQMETLRPEIIREIEASARKIREARLVPLLDPPKSDEPIGTRDMIQLDWVKILEKTLEKSRIEKERK